MREIEREWVRGGGDGGIARWIGDMNAYLQRGKREGEGGRERRLLETH